MNAHVNFGIYGAENININGGRKITIKREIYLLMQDGRERTTEDICNALKRKTWSLRVSTNEALRNMLKQGVVIKEVVDTVPIWRLATPEEQLKKYLASFTTDQNTGS